MSSDYFQFKQFIVRHDKCAMKVGTDGVLLGALAEGGNRILDIGTGTGLVAMMMAQRFPDAKITAIDIDSAASIQASENVKESSFAANITVTNISLKSFAKQEEQAEKYDSIVCNPPFFENSLECPDKQRSAARHSSSLPFSELLTCSWQLLEEKGVLTVIIPTNYVSRFYEECSKASLFVAKRLDIKTVERKAPKRTILSIRKRHTAETNVSTVCLMANGERSSWYADATRFFYL